MRLIAATRNPAKLAELRRVIGGLAAVEPLPQDISQELGTEQAEDTGEDLDAIAAAKAVAASRIMPGELVVATDGGLLIPALGDDWNPARTRRFAGEGATDLERARRLLALTAHLTGEERRIGWRESLAIARDGVILAAWSAESAPGLLAVEVDPAKVEAGGGFWLPALWICPEYGGRLLADLTPDERERLGDHWDRLAKPVRAWLDRRDISESTPG